MLSCRSRDRRSNRALNELQDKQLVTQDGVRMLVQPELGTNLIGWQRGAQRDADIASHAVQHPHSCTLATVLEAA
jgi:hypothetical protein